MAFFVTPERKTITAEDKLVLGTNFSIVRNIKSFRNVNITVKTLQLEQKFLEISFEDLVREIPNKFHQNPFKERRI